MLALDPARRAGQSGTDGVAPLRCFHSSVSHWARLAAERSNVSFSQEHVDASSWSTEGQVKSGRKGREGGASDALGHGTLADSSFASQQMPSVPAVKKMPAAEASLSSNHFGMCHLLPISCLPMQLIAPPEP